MSAPTDDTPDPRELKERRALDYCDANTIVRSTPSMVQTFALLAIANELAGVRESLDRLVDAIDENGGGLSGIEGSLDEISRLAERTIKQSGDQ